MVMASIFIIFYRTFIRAFQNEVDEVCRICSSKDTVQPNNHAENLNVNCCQKNEEKCPE